MGTWYTWSKKRIDNILTKYKHVKLWHALIACWRKHFWWTQSGASSCFPISLQPFPAVNRLAGISYLDTQCNVIISVITRYCYNVFFFPFLMYLYKKICCPKIYLYNNNLNVLHTIKFLVWVYSWVYLKLQGTCSPSSERMLYSEHSEVWTLYCVFPLSPFSWLLIITNIFNRPGVAGAVL